MFVLNQSHESIFILCFFFICLLVFLVDFDINFLNIFFYYEKLNDPFPFGWLNMFQTNLSMDISFIHIYQLYLRISTRCRMCLCDESNLVFKSTDFSHICFKSKRFLCVKKHCTKHPLIDELKTRKRKKNLSFKNEGFRNE